MTDITLTSVASGYNLSVINDNFDEIESIINTEVLHTTGGNNIMSQQLDMNSNAIINLRSPSLSTEPVRLQELQDAVLGIIDDAVGDRFLAFGTISLAIAADLEVGRKIAVYGYASTGDMPISHYVVVAVSTGTNDGVFYHNMDNGNQLKLIHNGIIDVRCGGDITGEFGALASKVLQAIKNNTEISAATCFINNATTLTATTPINATGLSSKAVTIMGASVKHINNSMIKVEHTGVGIDCTGSRNIKFSNISLQCSDVIIGTPTVGKTPKQGILLARTNPGASIDAGYHVFDNVIIDGHCSVASLYNYAAEVLDFRSTFITNRYVGNVAALYVTNDNNGAAASSFVTIATGAQSNSTLNFNGGQIWYQGSGGNGKAVLLRGASNMRWRDTFLQCAGGHSVVYIDGDQQCNDITFDGIREEEAPTNSIYYRGTVTGLSVSNYQSRAPASSGYFLFGDTSSILYNPVIRGITSTNANNGILMRDVHFPDIFFVGQVAVAAGSTCERGRISGTPLLITTAEACSLHELSTAQTCNLYQTLTGSVADTATTDINLPNHYPGKCLFAYMIQSNANSGHMSVGFFRTNAAGGAGNTLTLFGQSENNVAVTVPAVNTLRITNNTGGAAAFYVRISVVAG